jgi:hypothetical protein
MMKSFLEKKSKLDTDIPSTRVQLNALYKEMEQIYQWSFKICMTSKNYYL